MRWYFVPLEAKLNSPMHGAKGYQVVAVSFDFHVARFDYELRKLIRTWKILRYRYVNE